MAPFVDYEHRIADAELAVHACLAARHAPGLDGIKDMMEEPDKRP